nr:MAG TPA: hypothetical protein [Caudoviricetes sp.]
MSNLFLMIRTNNSFMNSNILNFQGDILFIL